MTKYYFVIQTLENTEYRLQNENLYSCEQNNRSNVFLKLNSRKYLMTVMACEVCKCDRLKAACLYVWLKFRMKNTSEIMTRGVQLHNQLI